MQTIDGARGNGWNFREFMEGQWKTNRQLARFDIRFIHDDADHGFIHEPVTGLKIAKIEYERWYSTKSGKYVIRFELAFFNYNNLSHSTYQSFYVPFKSVDFDKIVAEFFTTSHLRTEDQFVSGLSLLCIQKAKQQAAQVHDATLGKSPIIKEGEAMMKNYASGYIDPAMVDRINTFLESMEEARKSRDVLSSDKSITLVEIDTKHNGTLRYWSNAESDQYTKVDKIPEFLLPYHGMLKIEQQQNDMYGDKKPTGLVVHNIIDAAIIIPVGIPMRVWVFNPNAVGGS